MIERRDLGIGRIREQLAALGKARIMLGVQGDEAREQHPKAKVPKGTLALWLHAGTSRMRARPFVDVAISRLEDGSGNSVKKLLRAAVSDLIDGRADTAEDALVKTAAEGTQVVRDAIDDANSWVDWDLSEATVRRKGHDRHLIDTGETRDAVSYTIRIGGKTKKAGK